MDLIIYSGNKIDKPMSTLQSLQKKAIILQTPRTVRSHKKHEASLPSINPESETKNFKDRTLEKLVQINKEYLKDKVKIGDVRKPSKYVYRIPSKTGTSEYNRIFARSMPSSDLTECIPNRSKIANNLKLPNNGITNYQSTYNIQFTRQKQGQLLKKMQTRKPDRYESKQGPFFTETSYHRDYSSHTQSPRTSQVKPVGNIFVGGKFNEDTTYKQHYQSKDCLSPPKPITHKDHSIFVKIGKPKQSNYQLSYLTSKPQKMQESCKPVYKLASIVSKIKYRTQYSDKYVQQAPNEKKQFECLNNEQLKSYVLSILKH